MDEKQTEKLATNAFFKLEHQVGDEKKAEEAMPVLHRLQEYNDSHWKDPFTASQKLRKKFRTDKKVRLEDERNGQSLADKMSISTLKLLPSSRKDLDEARKKILQSNKTETLEITKKRLENSSIFESNYKHNDIMNDPILNLKRQNTNQQALKLGVSLDNFSGPEVQLSGIPVLNARSNSLIDKNRKGSTLVDYASD
jgi:hypothetical protein